MSTGKWKQRMTNQIYARFFDKDEQKTDLHQKNSEAIKHLLWSSIFGRVANFMLVLFMRL